MRKGMLVLFILLPSISQSQDKKISFTNTSWFNEIVPLGENGFVLQSLGSVKRIDSNANLVWDVPVEVHKGYIDNCIVVSPSCETYYNLQISGFDLFTKKPSQITQITNDGKTKSFQFEPFDYGKSLQAAFCDDQYLYYLTTMNGNEMKKGLRSNEKMILNRFEKNTFNWSKIILNLPALPENDNVTFWNFIGQNSTEKFLMTKEIDPKSGHVSAVVVSFNVEGKILREFSLAFNLENKFLRPAYSPVENNFELLDRTFVNVVNTDFEFYLRDSYPSHGYKLVGTGGFTTPYYDVISSTFYLFGLYGSKPYTNVGSIYEGFYVTRFDSNGKQLMSYQADVPEKLKKENYFRLNASPGSRLIELGTLGNGILNFSIRWNPVTQARYTFALTPEGKFLGYTEQYHFAFYGEGNSLKSYEYIERNNLKKSKNIRYRYFSIPSGEMLLVNDTKNKTMDCLVFKDE